MTRELKVRIIALQAMGALVLGFGAGFLYSESSFVTGMVNDQLSAQMIYFPPASAAVPGGSLDPAVYPDLQQYAGQQVNNGVKAKAYADGFIGRHLQKVAGGLTYSQVSAQAQANPTDPKLTAQKATLFQGEMLRGTLLNAWGWSQVGMYTLFASIGLALATLIVLAALVYEFATAWRRQPLTVRKPVTA